MDQFENIKKEYLSCQRCQGLVNSRTQVVFGSGNPKAKALFIGEAPGAIEDREGIPFCGAAGQVLNNLLSSVNILRDDVFVTNTLLCRPPENRNPTKEELNNCSDRLDKLIQAMKPIVIVTIGNFATERILKKRGVTSFHGKIFSITIHDKIINVVPVIHPANYLYSGRNPQLFKEMAQDFETIATLLKDSEEQQRLDIL